MRKLSLREIYNFPRVILLAEAGREPQPLAPDTQVLAPNCSAAGQLSTCPFASLRKLRAQHPPEHQQVINHGWIENSRFTTTRGSTRTKNRSPRHTLLLPPPDADHPLFLFIELLVMQLTWSYSYLSVSLHKINKLLNCQK